MSLLEPHADGWVLAVRAFPGAKANEIRGMRESSLCVAVTQAPEKGKANKALRDVLAKELGIKRSQIELISGETASQKKFLLRQIALEELQQILSRWTES